MTRVDCVYCGKPYIVESIQMMAEMNPLTGLERTFYQCPHCGNEYSIAVTDEYIRELMMKRHRMVDVYQKKPTPRRWRNIEKISKEIKDRMDKLNGRK